MTFPRIVSIEGQCESHTDRGRKGPLRPIGQDIRQPDGDFVSLPPGVAGPGFDPHIAGHFGHLSCPIGLSALPMVAEGRGASNGAPFSPC
jgi:hypothetical protein